MFNLQKQSKLPLINQQNNTIKMKKNDEIKKKLLEKLGLLHGADDVLEEVKFYDFPYKLWSKEISAKIEGATCLLNLSNMSWRLFIYLYRDNQPRTKFFCQLWCTRPPCFIQNMRYHLGLRGVNLNLKRSNPYARLIVI